MRGIEDDRGVTLVETIMAALIATVAIFGLGGLVFQVTAVSKNQGSETTRSVVFAQDKMENLLALAAYKIPGSGLPDFVDCTQPLSTPQPSACNTTNINDPGWTTGLVAGGGITLPPTPLVYDCMSISASSRGYIDYLDINGTQLPQAGTPPVPTPGGCSSFPLSQAAYVRQWQIADVITPGTGPAVKQITVAVHSLVAVGSNGRRPYVILTSYVENPN
jgi:hypothetical protein